MFTHADKKETLPPEEGPRRLINFLRGSSGTHVLHTLPTPQDTGWLGDIVPLQSRCPLFRAAGSRGTLAFLQLPYIFSHYLEK